MAEPYVVTGTLTNGRVVELDQRLPLGDARVKVSIEALSARARQPLRDVIAEIRRQQAECRYIPPTREEVDRFLAKERESWDR